MVAAAVAVVDVDVMAEPEPAGTVSWDLAPKLIRPDRRRQRGYESRRVIGGS
jgi:hypothetical protein